MDTKRAQTRGRSAHLKLELEKAWVMAILLQPPHSHPRKQERRIREQNSKGLKNT
jgi:hypothetical protein